MDRDLIAYVRQTWPLDASFGPVTTEQRTRLHELCNSLERANGDIPADARRAIIENGEFVGRLGKAWRRYTSQRRYTSHTRHNWYDGGAS